MIGPLPESPSMHSDRGYDSAKNCDLLEQLEDLEAWAGGRCR